MPGTVTYDPLTRPSGYRSLHPDAGLNFQLNRWLAWMTPDALGAVTDLATRIADYDDWTSEFLALGQRLRADGRTLDAALCLRAADFFMLPDDPRRDVARRGFLGLIRRHYDVCPDSCFPVPYGTATLSGYTFGEPRRGTILLHGGFDSYIEEFIPLLLAFARAGYRAVGFDGPGQGSALEDEHLSITAEWNRPVGAVLDHLGLDEAALVGVSLGGCLAVRAAAMDRRISRVVAFDVLTDFLTCNLSHLPAARRRALHALLALRARPLVDFAARTTALRDLLVRWALTQGMRVTGTTTPYAYLRATRFFRTAGLSPQVGADVLLLAGNDDHYVPRNQLRDQLATLPNARSVTARIFTAAESGSAHCQVGNLGLAVQVILDWLDGLDRRGRALT